MKIRPPLVAPSSTKSKYAGGDTSYTKLTIFKPNDLTHLFWYISGKNEEFHNLDFGTSVNPIEAMGEDYANILLITYLPCEIFEFFMDVSR